MNIAVDKYVIPYNGSNEINLYRCVMIISAYLHNACATSTLSPTTRSSMHGTQCEQPNYFQLWVLYLAKQWQIFFSLLLAYMRYWSELYKQNITDLTNRTRITVVSGNNHYYNFMVFKGENKVYALKLDKHIQTRVNPTTRQIYGNL